MSLCPFCSCKWGAEEPPGGGLPSEYGYQSANSPRVVLDPQLVGASDGEALWRKEACNGQAATTSEPSASVEGQHLGQAGIGSANRRQRGLDHQDFLGVVMNKFFAALWKLLNS